MMLVGLQRGIRTIIFLAQRGRPGCYLWLGPPRLPAACKVGFMLIVASCLRVVFPS